MDQLPFFVQPLMHTIRVSTRRKGSEDEEMLYGFDAIRHLQWSFVATDGVRQPTSISLEMVVPARGTINIFFDVLKNFVPISDFSYACEKGFDIGSAAWVEVDDEVGASKLDGGPETVGSIQQMHYTQGYIIMVPMPDFSMPFNVIALASTAITFFFGSVFRLTASGRLQHWASKKEGEKPNKLVYVAKKLFLLALMVLLTLLFVEEPQIDKAREHVPPELHLLVDYAKAAKIWLDKAKT